MYKPVISIHEYNKSEGGKRSSEYDVARAVVLSMEVHGSCY